MHKEIKLEKVVSEMSSSTNSSTSHSPDSSTSHSNETEDSNNSIQSVGGHTLRPDTAIAYNLNSTADTSPEAQAIKDLVANSKCSVRLTNAILSAKRLPAETISDYMEAPESMYYAFKSDLRNIGSKSVDELDSLVRSAHESALPFENQSDALLDHETQTLSKNKQNNMLNGAQSLLSGLRFPQDILDEDISVRLQNVLTRRHRIESESLFNVIKNFHQFSIDLLREPGFGRVTLHELTMLIETVIRQRLSTAALDPDLAPNLISGISGENMDESLFEAFESFRSTDYTTINWREKELNNQCEIEDVIARQLRKLSERENDVIDRRFGITQQNTQTLQEIADDFNVTRERIRQIEAKAKRKLIKGNAKQHIFSCLENENLIGKVFSGKKALSENRLKIALRDLSSLELLAIDLCFGTIKKFLNSMTVSTKGGWILRQYADEFSDDSGILVGTNRQKMLDAIAKEPLPLSVKAITSRLIDFTESEVRDELKTAFDATFDEDVITTAPRIPPRVRYVLILKSKKRSLRLLEIQAANYDAFGIDENVHHIQAMIGRMKEALIVGRGTYNLYENISLSSDDANEIRHQVYTFLLTTIGFVSVKVIFEKLFQSTSSKYLDQLNYHMLFGLLQDDYRFHISRGYMIGLRSSDSGSEYLALGEEALAVLSKCSHSMSVKEIAKALEGRRDTYLSSLSTSLDRMPQAVALGKSYYALTARIFGDEAKQDELINCCSILLTAGEKSVVAIMEKIEPIFESYPIPAFKSFLRKFDNFQVKNSLVSLVYMPPDVDGYIKVRDAVIEHLSCPQTGIEEVRKALALSRSRDFIYLDPVFISSRTESDSTSSSKLIDQLLNDFES